jgi:hypothetical protein
MVLINATPMAQSKRRNELTSVVLVLCRTSEGANEITLRFMSFIRNPNRCQFPGAL